MERSCRTCGELEKIRLNFGSNFEAEREFHSKDYFCPECIANEMDLLAREIDEFYKNEE